jgi:hypothetical protein
MRERNIENEILKQNKIPGCDQLTRPEEVKALSKYLKSIRTTQENHTSLEKDNLELPGRTTGRIPEINSLEDYIEGLDGVRGIKSLYKESSREPLSDNRNSDSAENHGLYTEKTRENLYDPRKTELEKHREDIVNKKNILEPTLEDRREELTEEPKELKSLGTEKLNLEGVRDVRNLYINTKENLKVPEKDLELGKERESLIDNHNLELDLTRIDLEGFKDLSYKEQLEVDSKNELDTTRISLEKTIETSELSSYREDLKETPEELDKLEDHREKLNSGKDNLKELEDTKVKLRNPVDDAELSKTKVSLERTVEDKELETYRENLRKTPEELDELENHKESLRSGEELKSLPEDKITLGGTVKVLEELGNTKIDLEGTEESEISTLEDYRENLSVEDNNSLEDTRVDLKGTVEYEASELEDARIDLTGTKESEPKSLEDKRIDLEDTKESEPKALENERIDLENTEESEISTLEDYLDDLENTKDYEASELEDTRIDLTGTKEFEPKSLEDERINLEGTKEYESSSLEDERIDLKGTEEAEPESLEDFIDKLEDTRDFELEDEKLELPETSGDGYEGYTPLGPEELDSLGGNINNFYDSLLEVPEIADAPRQSGDYTPLGPEELDSLGGDLGNFYDSILEVPETDNENYLSPEEVEKIIENPEQQYNYKDKLPEVAKGNSAPRVETEGSYNYLSPEEVEKIIENPTYFYNQQKEIPDAQAPDGQEIYKYSENPELSSEQVEGPPMKLPKFGLESLNLSNYLRWTAEKAVGWTGVHGEARQLLVNETLAGLVVARDELEKVTKSNRYRLPGNDGGLLGDLVSGGVSGALDNLGDKLGDAVNSIVGSKSVDISNPLNRPDENKFKYNGFEEANTRSTSSNASNPIKSQSVFSYDEIELLSKITNEGAKKNSSSSFWKKAGSALKDMALGSSGGERTYSFKNNYISGKGILITLEELCGISSDTDDTNTVEGLYNVLKSSPFITTPDKFTSTGYSNYNIQTLDTNAFWEIALEPYAGPENGDLNYLPGIHEINIRNIVMHGVNTAYNKWIPFTSFDLQKSKMTSKTLSLYDGEISYPVSMEFTNELRITIADDQYKSWRRYFEECAKAAIYNSEGHTSDYYILPPDEYSLTAIDTNNVCIAMYKNICFRCRIYVMTPQYSTIQKFDLLLVMKDFSEEYTGDIGDGAGDLTVSFSIVGENPNEGKIPEVKVIQHKAPDNSSKTDYGSIVESGVNSVMKLIK